MSKTTKEIKSVCPICLSDIKIIIDTKYPKGLAIVGMNKGKMFSEEEIKEVIQKVDWEFRTPITGQCCDKILKELGVEEKNDKTNASSD